MSFHRTAELAADPRVARGLSVQLAERRARIDAGDAPLGWKLAFGTPATMERLGTAAPLIGYLMRSRLIEGDAGFAVGGWTNPVLEPEVAAHVGDDGEIAALGPAFELADIDPPPEDPEAILAGNAFHRAVMVGRAAPGASPAELSGRIRRSRGETQIVTDVQAANGEIVPLVRHVADLLPAFGEALRPGDVVICGSIVAPPLPAAPGDDVEYELEPLGGISIRLTA
jgi:2-keto-4-pentenoate hydratase